MRSQSIRAGEIIVGALLASAASAQVPVTTTLVASGLTQPLCVTHAPGDTTRIFIAEKTGLIKIMQGGSVLGTPFLDMTSLVNTSQLEWGLASMCFDPNYATNGWFYVNYTSGAGGDSNIARFHVTANPNVADLSSRYPILFLAQPDQVHRGGWLGFGNDGYLYDSQGDGGGQNDPSNRAQNLALLQGKLLRLDVSGDDFPAEPNRNYRIPPTNPFVGQVGIAPEIWAYGLRNPWRCSFDRQTHELWIGDVGQDQREEIDLQSAGVGGRNYGWRCTEGTLCTGLSGCTCNGPMLTAPIHEYDHSVGLSITGGYVYRGTAIPGLQGTYFFGDFETSRFWSLRWNGTSVTNFMEITSALHPTSPLTLENPSTFGEDEQGELYVCDYLGGEVYKIIAAADVTPPVITITSPTSLPTWVTASGTIALGGTASDNVAVTHVTWSNSLGGSGTSSGTTNWSVPAIALAPGTNVITATAIDAALNSTTDVLSVSFYPAPVFYCSGDGSGTPCPCGNVGASGHGCPNSLQPNGGLIASSGTASLTSDTLVLVGAAMPSSSALYFQGTVQTNGGAGAVFGDGLRCAAGAVIRLAVKTNSGGTSSYPGTADPRISVRGAITAAPATRAYQIWYRNAASFCNPETFNLTNGLSVLWLN